MVFNVTMPAGTELEKTNHEDIFINHCVHRIKHQKMNLIVLVGQTGTGKSLAGLHLLEQIYAKLHPGVKVTAQDNVTFTTVRFLELVRTLPDKSGILFDETSIALNAKRSMSNLNLVLGNIFTAFRKRRFTLILCFPTFSALEKSVRSLTNFLLETKKIDHKEKLNEISCKYFQTNSKTGKQYCHSYKVFIEGQGSFIVPNIYTKLPTKELLDDYEVMKDQFIKDITNQSLEKVMAIERQDNVRDKLTERQSEVLYLKENGMHQTEIAAQLGISQANISQVLQAIRRKGVLIKE
jgi:predicted XRE-type DNA-binding protein